MILGPGQNNASFIKRYAVFFSILATSFYLGYVLASWHQQHLQKRATVMEQSADTLRLENAGLQSRINEMKIALDVAKLANEQHQRRLKELMASSAALKEQLGFYQRVMAPELSQDGFVVERIEVSPTSSNNTFTMSLILLQHENIKEQVTGALDIHLHGSLQGKPKAFRLDQLQAEAADALSFAFKYFQVINTSMTLPEDFVPERFEITTTVYKYKRRQGTYSTSVTWDEALNISE